MADSPVTLDPSTLRPAITPPAEPAAPGATVTDPTLLLKLNSPSTPSIAQDPEEQKNFLRQGFDFLRDRTTESMGKIFAAPGRAVLQGANALGLRSDSPEAVAGGNAAGEASATGIARDWVVPQTPGQAAAFAATLVPGVGWAPTLLRIGLASGLGSGANYATGYDPLQGAIQGAAGQTLGEGAGFVFNRVAAGRAGAAFSRLDDAAVPQAVGREVEAFAGMKTPADLKRAALGDGRETLGGWFGRQQKALLQATGDPEISSGALATFKALEHPAAAQAAITPEMAAVAKGLGLRKGEEPPGGWAHYIPGYQGAGQQVQTMPLSEALDLVKRLGATAFAGDKTALGFQLRQQYRQAQEDITAALGPKLGPFYEKMRDQYGAGLAILHAMKGDAEKIFRSEGNKVTFNRTPAETGGTPLQNAISASLSEFKNYGASPTVKNVFRRGEIGGGDARLRDFLNTLWLRQHGGSVVPGASVHTGVPGMPVYVGHPSLQPRGVAPGPAGTAGQAAVDLGSNLLDLNDVRP